MQRRILRQEKRKRGKEKRIKNTMMQFLINFDELSLISLILALQRFIKYKLKIKWTRKDLRIPKKI